MIASAASIAVRSHQDDSAYPPPSCSAFHGPQRLQAVRGDHVRHPVQEFGQVAGEVRVPGVAVHQVGAGAAGGDRQVDARSVRRAAFAPARSAGSA